MSDYSAFLTAVMNERCRLTMIDRNRARSAYLRSRQWSDKALETLAWHAFALAMDRDGDAVVRSALAWFRDISRTYRNEPVEQRYAWKNAYHVARTQAQRGLFRR